jgi:hypothetical protein
MSARKSDPAAATSAQEPNNPGKRASAKPRSPRKPGAPSRPAGSRVARAAQAMGKQISDNPFVALAGAAAVTAGIALLLPAGRREAQVMGELADKIGEVARDAADDAVQAGREQVAGLAEAALGSVGGTVVKSLIAASTTEAPDQSQAG